MPFSRATFKLLWRMLFAIARDATVLVINAEFDVLLLHLLKLLIVDMNVWFSTAARTGPDSKIERIINDAE